MLRIQSMLRRVVEHERSAKISLQKAPARSVQGNSSEGVRRTVPWAVARETQRYVWNWPEASDPARTSSRKLSDEHRKSYPRLEHFSQ